MSYLIYQLKVAVLFVIFYLIYRLVVKNSGLFKYNRIYIILSLILSFSVPFFKIELSKPIIPVLYTQTLPEVLINSSPVKHLPEITFEMVGLLILLFAGSIILYRSIIQLYKITKLSKSLPKRFYDGVYIIEPDGLEAFSFFRYIFVGKSIPQTSRDTILKHELVHAKQLHSVDIIIFEAALLMQWFNPCLWFFLKSIRMNHEFEADNALLNHGVSIHEYQEMLMNNMFQTNGVQFSFFNHNSFIKNRIKMMTNTSKRAGRTRFLLATVLSLMVVSLFSFKAEITQIGSGVSSKNVSLKDTSKNKQDNNVYLEVDQPATFQGKDLMEFSNYVGSKIKYPAEAVKNKLEGKVYVQFIVEKDGSIREAKILRGTALVLDNEALRVIKESPNWMPAKNDGKNVRQSFTLPVVFKLK